MKFKKWNIAVIGLSFLLYLGCGSENSNGPQVVDGPTTPVTVTMNTTLSASSKASKTLQAPAPNQISSVKIDVTDSLGAALITPVTITVTDHITPPAASFDVPSGTGRIFKATASDNLGIAIYAGQTMVDLPAGVLTPVAITMTPNTIFISPPSATLQPGQSISFVASVVGLTDKSVDWSVNGIIGGNSTIGTVTAGNPVTYTAPSTAPSPNVVTLTARSVSVTEIVATAQITILSIASIEVSPTTNEIGVGQTAQFFAVAKDANGFAIGGPQTFTWASSNTGAAAINSTGVATGVGAGTTNITASIGAITSNTATLKVDTLPPPFDFTVSNSLFVGTLSMIPGETRTLNVTVTLTGGATTPVALSISALPAGATAGFNPASVSPTGSSILSITTTAAAPIGQTLMTITGTAGAKSRTTQFNLDIRAANKLSNPVGVAIEQAGLTALVTEASAGRLVRVGLSNMAVTKTIASGLSAPNGLVIESIGTTAIVAQGNSLVRVDLSTGLVTTISSGLFSPYGVAVEAGGTTALVTDCGATNNCNISGRLVKVDLLSGIVTPITPVNLGLNQPRGVAIEAGGTTALVAESGTGKLLRVDLATGGAVTVATGFLSGFEPIGVAIEGGGATALITASELCGGNGSVTRVNLTTGAKTVIASRPGHGFGGIAIESGGGTALVTDTTCSIPGSLVRVNITDPVKTIAPSIQSAESLFSPYGVAVEAGGTTALVTDCGANNCSVSGRLVRVDLLSGIVTPITPVSLGLNRPRGVAIETGGATALVAELGTGKLLRVDLATGGAVTVATGFLSGFEPIGVAIEGGGATALITASELCGGNGSVTRVNLTTGAKTVIASRPGHGFGGIAIELGGGTALVTDTTCSIPGSLVRVNLSTGGVTTVSSGFDSPVDVKIETGGTTALVTETGDSGRLLRVDLATGSYTILGSSIGSPQSLSIEASGASALVAEGNRLTRISLSNPIAPKTIAHPLASPGGFAIESGGATALLLDCTDAALNCSSSGRMVRADLATGAITQLASGLNNPNGLAIEGGGTSSLVTDCGPAGTGNCQADARLLRVSLSGTKTVVTSGLNSLDGIAIEAGGATALVAERGAGRLLRVTLASGLFDIMASGLSNPRQVYIEAGGATALVAVDGGIARVNLAAKTSVQIVSADIQRFAVEAGGNTAIAAGTGSGFNASLYRVDLTTGSVAILMPGLFDSAHTILLEGTGATALVTESRQSTGALFRLNVPAP